jgi:hypothetical protein
MEKEKTIAHDDLLMSQLEIINWDELWIKLMTRCAYILRKRYNVNWSTDKLESFSHNIITEVIDKIFISKKRNWNTSENQEFQDFIFGAIDSHINNTLKGNDREIITNDEYLFDSKANNSPNIQDKISTDELRKQIYDELEKAGVSDEELLIFECLADGMNKKMQIRQELGIEEDEFNNLWRKFNRKREVIKTKLAEHGY